MKVLLNQIAPVNYRSKSNVTNVIQPQQQATAATSEFKLPGYNEVDRSLLKPTLRPQQVSFKANPRIGQLLKEIASAEEQLVKLRTTEPEQAIIEAQAELDKIKDWGDGKKTWQYAYEEASSAYDRAKTNAVNSHGFWWNTIHDGSKEGSAAASRIREKLYHAPKREIDKLIEKKPTNENLVNSGKTVKERIQENIDSLVSLIASKKSELSVHSLQEKINSVLHAEGGVYERIAGYEDIKGYINAKFVQKIIKSKTDNTVQVPSCFILGGPKGTGKTSMLYGIQDQLKDYAYFVDMSSWVGHPKFDEQLAIQKKLAKTRYRNEQLRTVILLNDAEKMWSMDEKAAATLGIKLDDYDIAAVKEYGNNAGNVSFYKQFLDDCAMPPAVEDADHSNRSAISFFVTTNLPHIIDPFLLRTGRSELVHVGLPTGVDLAAVIRYYFEQKSKLVDIFKNLSITPDSSAQIDTIVDEITPKGRENLKKMTANGTLYKLHIDTEHVPYLQLADFLAPSKSDGAYNNSQIKDIADNAMIHFMEKGDVNANFSDSFNYILDSTSREVTPAEVKKAVAVEQMIKHIIPVDQHSLKYLLKQKARGLQQSEEATNELKNAIANNRRQIEMLKGKEAAGPLDAGDINRKVEAEENERMIEATEQGKLLEYLESKA